MGKLISIAVTLAFLSLALGNLPRIVRMVRNAQIKLIQDGQASKWGKAWTPPSR